MLLLVPSLVTPQQTRSSATRTASGRIPTINSALWAALYNVLFVQKIGGNPIALYVNHNVWNCVVRKLDYIYICNNLIGLNRSVEVTFHIYYSMDHLALVKKHVSCVCWGNFMVLVWRNSGLNIKTLLRRLVKNWR